MTLTLKGLVKPSAVLCLLNKADKDIAVIDGEVDGYFFNGHYYLTPMDKAVEFFKAAGALFQGPQMKFASAKYQATPFVAVWNLREIKPGYAVIIQGTTGGTFELGNPLFHPDFGALAATFKDSIKRGETVEFKQSYMSWPKTAQDSFREKQHGAETGELLRCLRALTVTPSSSQKPSLDNKGPQ